VEDLKTFISLRLFVLKKMVDSNVVNYLKNYKDQFPLEALKKRILEAGYTEQNFNEAAASLGLIKKGEVQKPAPTPVKTAEASGVGEVRAAKKPETEAIKKEAKTVSQRKWMKTGGISGLALFALFVFVSGTFYIKGSMDSLQSVFSILLVILFLMAFVVSFFFLFGFVKLGGHIRSKFLVITSFVFMILIMLGLLSYAAYSLWGMFSPSITGFAVSNIGGPPSFGSDLKSTSLFLGATLSAVEGVVAIFIVSIFSLVGILFFLSLVIVGGQVRHAWLGGLLGLATLIVFATFFLILMFNDLIMVTIILSPTYSFMFMMGGVALVLVGVSSLILLSFSLLESSKVFEE
jgi:hypothetical protein